MFDVNAIGKQCPVPLIMTKNSIVKNGNGSYKVLVDNEIAVQNLEKLAKQYTFEFKFTQKNENEYEVFITVDDCTKVKETKIKQQNNEIKINDAFSKTNDVVVYKSQYMGHGDTDLGTVLVKGSIYAFSQLENPPKTFIFYNSGVKLVCEDSETLEDLKKLEQKGVKIFACGTCLNHYKLQDSLKIGSVTNMYDIVDMLNNATKVIIP